MTAQDNYIDDVITRLQDRVEKQAAEIERLTALVNRRNTYIQELEAELSKSHRREKYDPLDPS